MVEDGWVEVTINIFSFSKPRALLKRRTGSAYLPVPLHCGQAISAGAFCRVFPKSALAFKQSSATVFGSRPGKVRRGNKVYFDSLDLWQQQTIFAVEWRLITTATSASSS